MAKSGLIVSGKESMQKVTALAEVIRQDMGSEDELTRMLAVANGLVQLQDAMSDDAVALVMGLQGHELGFKTDKDSSGGYPAEVVKAITVRALMHGAKLINNEFNIISRGLYLTQAFFLRKLREFPGLTDLVIDVDAPDAGTLTGKNRVFLIGGYASCKVNGKLVEVFCRKTERFGDQRVTVKAYDNDTATDGAMGKAKKRIAQKLYERIAGVNLSDDDDTPTDATVTVVETPRKAIEQPAAPVATAASAERNWKHELSLHGVIDQGSLIRDAPTGDDIRSVLTAAKSQAESAEITHDAYRVLVDYAASKGVNVAGF
jgi:hypothetical protein